MRRVSRAFYLTIRILPRSIRKPVAIAYLLARAADTIADTAAVPDNRRLLHLLQLRQQLTAEPDTEHFTTLAYSLADAQPSDSERDLLMSLDGILRLLNTLPQADRDRVANIVQRLSKGMEFDLTRFPAQKQPERSEIPALSDTEELDRYTYLVAGCVGEFWTDLSMAHMPALARWERERMTQLSVEFGQALQMTNILRDIPRDLRSGRCYIPLTWLNEVGMKPRDLLDPDRSHLARPLLDTGLKLALEKFDAAERYLLDIPRRCVRFRLAAAWPMLMGLATLGILVYSPLWLDPAARVRVSRRWVYATMSATIPVIHSNRVMSVWIGRLRNRITLSI